MKRAILLGPLLVLLLAASTVETSTHDYYKSFTVPAGDTVGVRAQDFVTGAMFQGTYSFWWDEGLNDRLTVIYVDLVQDTTSAGVYGPNTWRVAAAETVIYRGGWAYGARGLADSAWFDGSCLSDTLYGDVVGDAKDYRFYGRTR